MEVVAKAGDPTVVYLLQQLDFNSLSAYYGYESKKITIDQIIMEMEKFVQKLPARSTHFKYIRVRGNSDDFNLSLGQKSSLAATMDAIIDHFKPREIQLQVDGTSGDESLQVDAPSLPRRRRRDIEIDLMNIQEIWNQKIGKSLELKGLSYRDFPIIRSLTEKFPYKFFINCPVCTKTFFVILSLDVKGENYRVANYRTYKFTTHVVSCAQLNLSNNES